MGKPLTMEQAGEASGHKDYLRDSGTAGDKLPGHAERDHGTAYAEPGKISLYPVQLLHVDVSAASHRTSAKAP